MLLIMVIAAFCGLLGAVLYNHLVRDRMLVREAWSGIDVQLKRRHDLIPNIVESVKGYMGFEQKVLEDVTRLRSQLDTVVDQNDKARMENSLSRGLKSIFALAENYPDLKANKSFLELQNTLIAVEDELQLARRYYNGTVRNYNIMVESFPSAIVAMLFHFPPAAFFEIEYATERKTPDVKF
ncbi:MAG TPA: LemA family protein [Candidatus Omnitrophota bacterium]|nr:LemA family protein [Candidatus Omnitrophota bacterium]HRZ15722.1 LemA family protein [Candidatus Omnitrophota bacterium]